MSKQAWGGDNNKKKRGGMGAGKKTKVEPAGPDAVAEGKENEKKSKEKPTIGPNAAKRGSIVFCGCTDCICCIIFIVFLLGMFVLAVIGMVQGQVERLFYGTDYEGNTCGVGDYSDLSYIHYPLDAQDVNDILTQGVDAELFGICVSECPEDTSSAAAFEECDCVGEGSGSYTSVLSALSCPDELSIEASDCRCTNEVHEFHPNYYGDGGSIEACWPIVHKTVPILFRCVPWGDYDVSESTECTDQDYNVVYWDYYANDDEDCSNNSYQNREDTSYAHYLGQSCGADCSDTNSVAYLSPTCQVLQNPDNPACIAKKTTTTTVTTGPSVELPLLDQLQGGVMTLSRYFGDLATTSVIWIGVGSSGACILGFVWLVLLKFFAGLMVWTSLAAVFLVLCAGTVVSAVKAGYFTVEEALSFACDNANSYGEANCTLADDLVITDDFLVEGDDPGQWKIFFYIMAAVTVIFLCIIIALFNRIRLAIRIIKEASKALRDMPLLVFFPFIPMFIMVVIFIIWILIALALASAGDLDFDAVVDLVNSTVSDPTSLVSNVEDAVNALNANSTDDTTEEFSIELNPLTMNENTRYALAYHTFGLLWIGNFVGGLQILIIAGAALQWYWVKTDEKGKRKLPKFPIFKSIYISLRHHMGTAAFGGCIIAICQAIRIILAYIDKKTKKAQEGNKALKIFMKVIQICMACFEKILKFISRNAYIMTALTGKSFCFATKDAFLLIFANMGRVAAVNIVSTIILFLGKVFVCVASAVITYNLIFAMYNTSGWESDTDDKEMVGNVFFPTFMAGLLAYFIATIFFYVYDIVIDALIISFCHDVKMNENRENKEYYMPESLRKFVSSKGKDDDKEDKKP